MQPLKKYVKILAIQKKSCDRAAGCRMRAQRGCVAVSTPRRQCRPSPVSFRLNALRSMCSAAIRHGRFRATYEKDYEEKMLKVDTWFENGIPIYAEVCYNGQRILNLTISEFSLK